MFVFWVAAAVSKPTDGLDYRVYLIGDVALKKTVVGYDFWKNF